MCDGGSPAAQHLERGDLWLWLLQAQGKRGVSVGARAMYLTGLVTVGILLPTALLDGRDCSC